MRYIRLYILSLVLTSLLIGCQNNQVNLLGSQDITSVSISASTGFGTTNTEFFVTYSDEISLTFFEQLLAQATKESGSVNMPNPEYDMEVLYMEDENVTYHLWVGDSGHNSTIMKAEDTHTIYTISEDFTLQLIEMIEAKDTMQE
ncbi:hypothetical protein [Sutcliffiella rhizosphaerae]|uniref:YhfM-like domain-containing protein n=1 Tax=Sutcliffiella rhizosphaerae TaxID=2880967 RepID=A0ABN8ACC4_9BACI|nr:hypothetical protein [Sutcliffiella rhizosphaerae]CAG9620320.1 hypothetical protein BACCIP111883_01088 [Sutcliffiella rhizosphaerae]